MKITKSQLRKLIKEEMLKEVEEMSPEFSNSMEILGLALQAKEAVKRALVSRRDLDLKDLNDMLQELVDRLPGALK